MGMFTDRNEEMESNLKDMAILSRKYYKELLAQGFTNEQAIRMVITFQKGIFGGGR